MISNVSSPSALGAGALTGATGGADLGKDAFLKLLVAQIQHQDPLKPLEDTQFVTELAQFSALEQTLGINARLDLLATQNQGMANTQIAALAGSRVTVRGSMVTSSGNAGAVQVAFELQGAAESTRVQIVDAEGRVVRTLDLGDRPAGLVQATWDGRNDQGMLLPAGQYRVSVEAKSSGGGAVGVLQESSGLVEAVSFEKGYPLLHLDNGLSVPASELLRVEPKQ
ncbi:MAG: flagellar hook assembly protein FlgD [Polyangiaceae bacterium]|nr:flagellar hook assembly protein FlgD [Polyangiaceae bacterium]